MGKRGPQSMASMAVARPPAVTVRHPAPPGLGAAECARWQQIVASEDAQHFREADLALLAVYVAVLVRLDVESAQLAAEGSVEVAPTGRRRANPRVAIVDSLVRQAATLAGKLRLCPSSRGPRKSAGAPAWQGLQPAILFRDRGNP